MTKGLHSLKRTKSHLKKKAETQNESMYNIVSQAPFCCGRAVSFREGIIGHDWTGLGGQGLNHDDGRTVQPTKMVV